MNRLASDGQFVDPEVASLDPLLHPLLAYWKNRRPPDRLPARADIDPLDIPRLLPFLFLVDVERIAEIGSYRFRYRLVGTEIVARDGADITGRYADTMPDRGFYASLIADYTRCAEEGRPLAARRHYYDENGKLWTFQRILLPLSDDGKIVNMLLGGNAFSDRPEPQGMSTSG